MKAFEKVFACILITLGLLAFIATLAGARHQFVFVVLCAVLAMVMWPGKSTEDN